MKRAMLVCNFLGRPVQGGVWLQGSTFHSQIENLKELGDHETSQQLAIFDMFSGSQQTTTGIISRTHFIGIPWAFH